MNLHVNLHVCVRSLPDPKHTHIHPLLKIYFLRNPNESSIQPPERPENLFIVKLPFFLCGVGGQLSAKQYSHQRPSRTFRDLFF